MGPKFRVLIGDNSRFWEKAWGSWLDLSQFEIREVIPNAISMFETICSYRPHIIIASENMDYISGIGMMKAVSAIPNYHPQFIITDELPTNEKYQTALKLGAAFYISRPYSYTSLNSMLLEIVSSSRYYLHCPLKTPEQVISDTLRTLQIPANLKGYRYLRCAIKIAIRGGEEVESITKGLYPAIAQDFHTTAISVERAIRHAVTLSWQTCQNQQNELFQSYFGQFSKKPSNSRFILTIAEHLEEEWKAAQEDFPDADDVSEEGTV